MSDHGGTSDDSRALQLAANGASAKLILPSDVPASAADAIQHWALWSIQTMSEVAEQLGIPLPELEIWTLDLSKSLTALAPRVGGPPVNPDDVERVGGEVGGKTMPLEDDWSRAAIAAPAAGLASGDGRIQALALFGLLHEMGHTLVERLGTLSGVREIGWHPTNHSRRKAENAVRHGLDEWRVSTMASVVINAMITTADGKTLSIPELAGGTHRSALGEVLARAYPGWPGAVQRYRVHQLALENMYAQVVGETVDIFTYLSHCEAETQMLERTTPLRDEYATHPATRLYLGEPWGALLDCDAPKMPALSEFADAERTHLSEVAPKVIEMWHRLGLTFTDGPSRWDLRIDVDAPLRDTDQTGPNDEPG